MPCRAHEVACVWSNASTGIRLTPNALVGAVVGVGYLLTGVVCTAVALGAGMAASPGHDGAGLGAAHCGAYLAVGAALLCAVVLGRARAANSLIGATYLGLGLLLLSVDGPQLLALQHPDAVVHLGTAAVLLGFGRTQE